MAIAEVKSVTNSCFINGSSAYVGQTIDYGDLIETYDIKKGLSASVKSDTIDDDGILNLFFPADKSFMKIKPHIKTSFDEKGNAKWAGANLVKISPEDTELGTKVIPLGTIFGAAGPIFIQRNIKKYPEFKDKTETGIEKISPERKMAIYPDDKLLIGETAWIKIEVAPFNDELIQHEISNILLLFRSGQNRFRFTKRSVEPLIKKYLDAAGIVQSGLPYERLRYYDDKSFKAYLEAGGLVQTGFTYNPKLEEGIAIPRDPFDVNQWVKINFDTGKQYPILLNKIKYYKSISGGKYYEAFEQGFYDELFGVDTKYLHLKPGSSAEAGEPFATLAVEVSGHPPTTNIRAS
jgi:hypothetical protein